MMSVGVIHCRQTINTALFENDAAECPLVDSCALNAALREALGAFFAVLERHTIADLVKAKSNVRSLLGIDLLAPRAWPGDARGGLAARALRRLPSQRWA